jgi:hypothetical protein
MEITMTTHPVATGPIQQKTPSIWQFRYVAPIIAFILAAAGDAITTVLGVHTGLVREGDLPAAWVFAHYGLGVIALPTIVGFIVAVGGLAFFLYRRVRVIPLCIVGFLWANVLIHGFAVVHNIADLHTIGIIH